MSVELRELDVTKLVFRWGKCVNCERDHLYTMIEDGTVLTFGALNEEEDDGETFFVFEFVCEDSERHVLMCGTEPIAKRLAERMARRGVALGFPTRAIRSPTPNARMQ